VTRIDSQEQTSQAPATGGPDWRDDFSTGLGQLALVFARLFLVMVPTIMLGALFTSNLPANIVFVLPALGFLVLTPRRVLLRLPLTPTLIIFCMWMSLSLLWSVDASRSLFLIREDLAPILGIMIVFGILPLEESLKWFVRGIKVMIVITVLVLLFVPETRLWIRDGLESEAWRGWFLSKNEMGRSMLVAFMVLLYLDKTRFSRWIFMALAVALLLGSSSATALAGAMFAVGIWFWGLQFRRTRRQWSGMFIFTSVVLGVFVLLAAFLSAAFLVELLGRDLSFSGRTDVWVPSLDYVQSRPILGYGYRALFGSPTQETLDLWRDLGFKASHSHNGPLEIALGMGLIGLGMFFLVYLSTFTAALRYLKEFDVAVFSFCFMLVMLPVAVVEPVFQGDWFAVLVVCRMLLLRVRVETRGQHVPSF